MDKVIQMPIGEDLFDRSNTIFILNSLSLQGYVLYKIKRGKYHFKKIETKTNLIYQYDIRNLNKIQEKEYLSYVSDWTYAASEGGFYWFYTEEIEGKHINNFFINNEQKLLFRKRQILQSLVFLLIYLVPLSNLLYGLPDNLGILQAYYYLVHFAFFVFSINALRIIVKSLKSYMKQRKAITE